MRTVEVISFSTSKATPGKLSEALVFENDIVSPLGEDMWNACNCGIPFNIPAAALQ